MGDAGGGGVAGEFQRDQGGAHASEAWLAQGVLVDGAVRGADGTVHTFERAAVKLQLLRGLQKGGGGFPAGNFTTGGTAHAVADDEEAKLRIGGAGVFVVCTHAANIRQHGETGLGEGKHACGNVQCPTVHGL